MTQKVVVTGGAGFIGSHLVDQLVALGYDVIVYDNMIAGRRENVHPKARLVIADIRDYASLCGVCIGATYVHHLAALPRVPFSIEYPLESADVNIMGTMNVLHAARIGKVRRVVFSSSSSVYGNQPVMPLVETMPATPMSPYGGQKYTGEVFCKVWSDLSAYNLNTVCLRYFNVYGPRFRADSEYSLVIGKFLQQRAAGNPLTIKGDGSQTRDFTHVSDVVRANILAMTSNDVGRGEAFNIGAGNPVSINRIAALIGGPVVHEAPRLEPHDTCASSAKAKWLLGWEPRIRIEDGIAELKELLGLS